MSDIELYGSSELLPRDTRRAGRAVSKYQARGQVRIATTDVETDVSLAKVDAITAVTGQSMGAVVRVAQAQRHLELMAPEASGRLAMLADEHVFAMLEVSGAHRRTLGRK